MDAFFAAVEQLDRPDLAGKPVIVGADPKSGRGVVSAANYEARKYGVHSALPITQAFARCPHGVFLRPRYSRYKEISDKVFEIFHSISSLVEPLSIDEAFIDLTGTGRLHGDPVELGRKTKRRILETTGLVASVGIAPNKFLAKIASDFGKPDGFVVVPEDGVQDFLDPLDIGRLWGVGPKTGKMLIDHGIRTVGDLSRMTVESAKKLLGDHGEGLWKLAHGIDSRPVSPGSGRKGISKETTFRVDVTDNNRKISTLRRLSDGLAARMRAKKTFGRTITVKIRYSGFITITRSDTLDMPIATSDDIFREAQRLARPELEGSIRLLGIRISNLTGEEGEQLPLFGREERNKTKNFERALDDIQKRFGKDAISRANSLEKDDIEDD